VTRNYGLINSIDELARFCDRLSQGDDAIAFDIETGYLGVEREKFSLHPETALVAGISFTVSADWARYAPLGHDDYPNLDNLDASRLLWPLLNTGRGVAHNAPFELRHLARWFRDLLSDDPDFGEQVRASDGYFPVRSDTQVESYLAAEHPQFGLKYLAWEIFGIKMTELHELFPGLAKNKRKYLRFNTLDPREPRVFNYACEDSVGSLLLHQRYHEYVREKPLYPVEMGIVEECIPPMEDFGVRYDWLLMRRTAEALRSFRDRYNAEIMRELSDMVGQPVAINIASPPQLSKLLFEQLGFRTTVYTAKTRDLPPEERKMSTGKIALAGLAKKHPVVQKIRDWKEMTRLLGTYLEKYEGLYAYAADGRTHPNHMSAVVVTGRFAVGDPPYQQSPKVYHYDLEPAREAHAQHAQAHGPKCTCDEFPPPPDTCFKFNFRDVIVAPPDHYILGFDLSQAELRAIAGEAQEPALLKAFADGTDVHTLTAALMLKVSVEDVTKDQRDIGKTMNFALLYGMREKSLADRLGIPIEEAKELYEKYFSVYSRIAAWAAKQVELGRTYGYVTSRFGRKLPIWEYRSEKRWIRQKGDRACVNYPIQGSATGDFVKIAMVRAQRALRAAGIADRVHLVMNVHDALEFYVHRTLLPQDVIRILQPAVIFPVDGWPAMKADWHFGRKWGSPYEIEVTEDNRFIVKGEVEYELKPSIEEDEDTGEEVEVFPEIDYDVLRQALGRDPEPAPPPVVPQQRTSEAEPHAPAQPSTEEGRQLILELLDMPTAAGYERFLELLDSLPGPHQLTLRTPDGELPLSLGVGTSLGTKDLAQVYLLLGEAKLYFDAADVDSSTLLDGITL